MRRNGARLLFDSGTVKIMGVRISFVSGKKYLSLAVSKSDIIFPPHSSKFFAVKTNASKKCDPFKIVSLPHPPTWFNCGKSA